MMENEKKELLKNKFKNAIYYVASLLMPSILLFNLYNQNHARSIIVFMHTVIVAVILSLIGVLLFIIFRFLVKSVEGALLASLLFWLFFWLFEMLLDLTRIFTTQTGPRRLLFLMFILLVVTTITFRKSKSFFQKARTALNALAFCFVVLFVFNLIPGLQNEWAVARGRVHRADQESSYIKQEFYVDSSLPTPDIYWLHLDGLMSIEMVERFWGGNYDGLREELKERGFLVYEDAMLNGGFTWSSLYALLSPAFYDRYWSEQLSDAEHMLLTGRVNLLRERLTQVGLDTEGYAIPQQYGELFNAFLERGYGVDTGMLYGAAQPGMVTYVVTEMTRVEEEWRRFRESDLPELLSLVTPLPYHPNDDSEGDVFEWRDVERIESTPLFTWMDLHDAHYAIGVIMHMENPTPEIDYPMHVRYDLYPLVFEYAMQRMLQEIDIILESNSNAIIVLQADHGFHLADTQLHMINQGYSVEQVLELTHSVFSAVRITDEYGGLERPIAPLNITRELVNRFVGENYELLP